MRQKSSNVITLLLHIAESNSANYEQINFVCFPYLIPISRQKLIEGRKEQKWNIDRESQRLQVILIFQKENKTLVPILQNHAQNDYIHDSPYEVNGIIRM